MIVKGKVSAIHSAKNTVDVILPEYNNIVVTPLNKYNRETISNLKVDDFVLVLVFNNDFNDTMLLLTTESSGGGSGTGEAGADGFSPTIDVIKTGTVTTLTITDKDGTETAKIYDGAAGSNGKDGSDGKDGVSPTVKVDTITGGHRLTITDKNGAKTVDIIDGQDGKDGKDGAAGYTPVKGVDYFDGTDGKDGSDGKDGYTPVKGVDYFDGTDGSDGKDGVNGVSCTHSWNGTTLTVTSASGTSSADLKGETGAAGANGADGKTPVKGTDYYTAADKAEMVNLVLAALPKWNGGSY